MSNVYNQAVVDWMRQRTIGEILTVREKCLGAGWTENQPDLLDHCLWLLATNHYYDNNLADWTPPTARDAQEALRFLNK